MRGGRGGMQGGRGGTRDAREGEGCGITGECLARAQAAPMQGLLGDLTWQSDLLPALLPSFLPY